MRVVGTEVSISMPRVAEAGEQRSTGGGNDCAASGSAAKKKGRASGGRSLSSSSLSSERECATSRPLSLRGEGEAPTTAYWEAGAAGTQSWPLRAPDMPREGLSKLEGSQRFDMTCKDDVRWDGDAQPAGLAALELQLRGIGVATSAHNEKLGAFCAMILSQLSSMDRELRDQIAAVARDQDQKHEEGRRMLSERLEDTDRQWREEVGRLSKAAGERQPIADGAPLGRLGELARQLREETAAVARDQNEEHERGLGRVRGQLQSLDARDDGEVGKAGETDAGETLESLDRKVKGLEQESLKISQPLPELPFDLVRQLNDQSRQLERLELSVEGLAAQFANAPAKTQPLAPGAGSGAQSFRQKRLPWPCAVELGVSEDGGPVVEPQNMLGSCNQRAHF